MPPRSPLVVLAASWVHFASNVPPSLPGQVYSTRRSEMQQKFIVFRYTTNHPEYKSLSGFRGYKPDEDDLLEPVDLLRGHKNEVVADGHE